MRRVLIGLGVLLVIVGGVIYWALDRYVIDHVQIGDVAAYEAAHSSSTTVSSATIDTVADVGASSSAPTSQISPTSTTAVPTTTIAAPQTSISIQKVVTGAGDETLTYFAADVVLADATLLRSGFAENKFGTNIVADTSVIAKYYDATFAINGDYYGFRESGIVVRDGIAFRDKGTRTGLAFYRDGSMKLYDERSTTADELVAGGVWNTLSFGPGLLENGQFVPGMDQVEVDTNLFNHSIQGRQPRTGIGIINANHLLFVVADGRSPGYSRGVTMTEFATIFKDLGATEAYNLDGGGSATMYFNGAVVNNPLGKGKERGTSDILYIVAPEAIPTP